MTVSIQPSGQTRSGLRRALEGPVFLNAVTGLIVTNAVILGILTYDTLPPSLEQILRLADQAITWLFVVEILVKLAVYGFGFFRSGWNWFDFVVVGISIMPFGQGLSVLRALRVLRVLRLLHIVPMMRQVTEAMLRALPGMGAILALLGLITYVAAVMATNMYGDSASEDVAQLFHDLPSSAISLFQVMTMDGWRFEVVQKVVDDGHEFAWVFFLTFIFVASFLVLNLFIALIVEALQLEQEAMQEEHIEALEDDAQIAREERRAILVVLGELREELAELRRMNGARRPGHDH